MRSYLEVADRVFERGEQIKAEQRRKAKRAWRIGTSLAACLVVGVAVWACIDTGIIHTGEKIASYDEHQTIQPVSDSDAVTDSTAIKEKESSVNSTGEPENEVSSDPEESSEEKEWQDGNTGTARDSVSPEYAKKENGSPVSEDHSVTEQPDEMFASNSVVSNDYAVIMGPENNKTMIMDDMMIINTQEVEIPAQEYDVNITLYRDGVPVSDSGALQEEMARLIENGIPAELNETGVTAYFTAVITAVKLDNFPCSSDYGYVIDVMGVSEG